MGRKVLSFGDAHGEYVDDKAYNLMLRYAKKWKPDEIIINGDMVDFYALSKFDKNPERRTTTQQEIYMAQELLGKVRSAAPTAKIVYLKGNHEDRLQKFLWRNPELHGMDALDLKELLGLKELGIKYVDATTDYWKATSGHYKIGDLLVMHGDNRLNGASTSRYAGYSAKNTMNTLQHSVLLGHTHRAAIVYQTNPSGIMVGIEGGCLCQKTGTANWQQGFVTFEVDKGRTYKHKFHLIDKGKLIS